MGDSTEAHQRVHRPERRAACGGRLTLDAAQHHAPRIVQRQRALCIQLALLHPGSKAGQLACAGTGAAEQQTVNGPGAWCRAHGNATLWHVMQCHRPTNPRVRTHTQTQTQTQTHAPPGISQAPLRQPLPSTTMATHLQRRCQAPGRGTVPEWRRSAAGTDGTLC